VAEVVFYNGGMNIYKNFDRPSARAEKTEGEDSIRKSDAFQAIKDMTTKSKIAFIIPETDNRGNAFSKEFFGWIDRTLCDLGSGFHYHPVYGGWVNNKGIVQCENCRKYHVGIDEKKVSNLFQLLVKAKEVFQQEALYIEYAGQIVILE
jgi:hypothetical protein